MVFLREYKPTDFKEVSVLHDQLFPEYVQDDEKWRAGQQFDYQPDPLNKFVVIEETTGQLIGYSGLRPTHRQAYWRLDLMVHPQRYNQGIGSILFEHMLMHLYKLEAIGVHARVRGDKISSLNFLLKRGFAQIHQMIGMSLNLSQFDSTHYEPLVRQVLTQGIEITTLALQQAKGVDYFPRLLSLHNSVLVDWLDPIPGPPIPYTVTDYKGLLEKTALKEPQFFFIACDKENYVGFSGPFALGTAVHPIYRHKGVATALKVCSLKEAKASGLQYHFTSSANTTMIGLNERLGYRPYQSEVRLVKTL